MIIIISDIKSSTGLIYKPKNNLRWNLCIPVPILAVMLDCIRSFISPSILLYSNMNFGTVSKSMRIWDWKIWHLTVALGIFHGTWSRTYFHILEILCYGLIELMQLSAARKPKFFGSLVRWSAAVMWGTLAKYSEFPWIRSMLLSILC